MVCMTILCISCFLKGQDFLRACKEAGNTIYLLTKESLRDADWPHDSIDEFFFMESDVNTPENFQTLVQGMSHLMRQRNIDRIVAMDDFDVEKAAWLREEFRIPGMGQTTARYFRDKLAMRMKAADAGIAVPPFSALFNDEEINHFHTSVSAPWVIKPRGEASATGIRKVHTPEESWSVIHELGDKRHTYLIEQFKPGDVYHTDALCKDGQVVFCRNSKYLNTPFEVAHGGGIFRSQTLPFGEMEDKALKDLTSRVMTAFGMQYSAAHTEFIRTADGTFYFLETSSRVGGAHLAEMVEFSAGISLWKEWAKLESDMAGDRTYKLPKVEEKHAGILVSLSRYQWPDMAVFNDPEVVWKINKEYHVGMIIASNDRKRVSDLLDKYAEIVARDFHASAPPPDRSLD
ncbi:MAG: ATPase [Bacteroidetes bacterium]|nr:ATPase [Bacteroidota bacterium]